MKKMICLNNPPQHMNEQLMIFWKEFNHYHIFYSVYLSG